LRGKNIIISSGADLFSLLRGPIDVIAIAQVLNISKELSVKTIAENSALVIQHSNDRKNRYLPIQIITKKEFSSQTCMSNKNDLKFNVNNTDFKHEKSDNYNDCLNNNSFNSSISYNKYNKNDDDDDDDDDGNNDSMLQSNKKSLSLDNYDDDNCSNNFENDFISLQPKFQKDVANRVANKMSSLINESEIKKMKTKNVNSNTMTSVTKMKEFDRTSVSPLFNSLIQAKSKESSKKDTSNKSSVNSFSIVQKSLFQNGPTPKRQKL
jgi:hypothetical protein